jgi:hypothetical protein
MPNDLFERGRAPDVSIVLPCLNQVRALPFALANARAGLISLERELGLTGEIILADAGSRDGSQMVAIADGVRVVDAPCCGYGAALRSGLSAARGRYLVMGDLDGSCDFRDCVPMIRALMRGTDLCLGMRVSPAASLWQWIFRPLRHRLLALFLRWFFGVYLVDPTCRLRAVSAAAFHSLRLRASGVEFTTEMIIKAALLGHRICESPSHVRRRVPGGRKPLRLPVLPHLRFVVLLSPAWAFLVPSLLLVAGGVFLGVSCLLGGVALPSMVTSLPGNGVVLAGVALCLAHLLSLFALGAHLYACREGFRHPTARRGLMRAYATIRGQLGLAAVLAIGGLCVAGLPLLVGSASQTGLVVGVSLILLALQSSFAAFLVAILGPSPESEDPLDQAQQMPVPPPKPARLSP